MFSGWLSIGRKKRMRELHVVMVIYAVIFIVWGLYRLEFRLPEWFEEVVLKFIVFGLPVFWYVLVKEKNNLSSLGMVTKGLLASVYFGLLFGLWLAVFGNLIAYVRTGGLGLNTTIGVKEFGNLAMLGMVTSFWEQLLFSGFILPRVIKDVRNEWAGVILVGILFALLHLPVQIVSHASLSQIYVRMILLLSLGIGNSILYLRFKNLAAPIFAHLAWGSVIFLFG
jgi:membrane protease YdiL (CAAX protease family)